VTSAGVLNAAAHAKGEEGKTALKYLLPELERNPFNVGLLLTILQIYLIKHNPTSATRLLEAFFKRVEDSSSDTKQAVRFNPGLVALAVRLYRSQGRRSRASRELAQAASHWRQSQDAPTTLLQAAGTALLESSNSEDVSSAADIFSKLHDQDSEDRIAAAGYVAAYATTDPSRVKAEVERLAPLTQLVRDVDVDALENAGIPQSSKALAIAQKTASRKRGAPDQASNKRKRIRKSRLPKDYDPAKAPDPERWLPLRDRSTYRPKGKKGKKKDADRTQGGIVADDVGVKDTGLAARPPAGGGGGGGANKKNKKKGKR
jgi:signal recognition particle subunit SRP72